VGYCVVDVAKSENAKEQHTLFCMVKSLISPKPVSILLPQCTKLIEYDYLYNIHVMEKTNSWLLSRKIEVYKQLNFSFNFVTRLHLLIPQQKTLQQITNSYMQLCIAVCMRNER